MSMFKPLAMMAIALLLVGCSDPGSTNEAAPNSKASAQEEAQQRIEDRSYEIPNNDVEFNNYNRRIALGDDPTSIIWCTAVFDNPSMKALTFPIAGKLTSGSKRPYATERAIEYGGGYTKEYEPELPGPDGMYGSSSDYRYGFTPGEEYVDFTNVSTICTSTPMVVQTQEVRLALTINDALAEADQAAQQALAEGDTATATDILLSAVKAANEANDAAEVATGEVTVDE